MHGERFQHHRSPPHRQGHLEPSYHRDEEKETHFREHDEDSDSDGVRHFKRQNSGRRDFADAPRDDIGGHDNAVRKPLLSPPKPCRYRRTSDQHEESRHEIQVGMPT